jgi:hypothetical protein
MAPSSTLSSDSVASRVRRFPRTASREARTRLAAFFAPSVPQAPVARTQRAERTTPSTCRYMLRSMRRQQA